MSVTKFALAIDHIAENIFFHLDAPTLKTCRKVCNRWKILGALELRSRVSLTLGFRSSLLSRSYHQRTTLMLDARKLPSCLSYNIAYSSRNLERLLTIAQRSPMFPCTSFEITTAKFTSPEFQRILWCLGHIIRKLDLCSILNPSNEYFNSSKVMDRMLRLLTKQAPNIACFNLLWVSTSYRIGLSNTWNFSFPVQNLILPDLRYLRLSNEVPSELFDTIMDAAVNLNGLTLQLDRNLDDSKFKYFEKESRRDRVRVLKELEFSPQEDTLSIVETFVSQHKWNISLRHFKIEFSPGFNLSNRDLMKRLIGILNQILKSSAHTLNWFATDPLRFMDGIEVPIMPKLNGLELKKMNNLFYVEEATQNCFFPNNFNMKEGFPNLEVIKLARSLDLGEELFSMLDNAHVISSVKTIIVMSESEIIKSTFDRIREFFPKAFVYQWEHGNNLNNV